MPGSSNTSFIPKHTPSKAERKSAPRQLFLGTVLVRILFFAVLIAAAVTFFYERSLSNKLAAAIINFNTAASSYDADADKLSTVIVMDNRLRQARELFAFNVPTSVIFDALERATVASAQLTAVSISREKSDQIVLEASVRTDTFDSTIFQRSIFSDSDILARADIEDVTMEGAAEEGETSTETDIIFKATMTIDPDDIPMVLTREAAFVPVETITSEETATTSEAEAVSEETQVEVGFSAGNE